MPTLGRIVRPADYSEVLRRPARWRSAHFAVHHAPEPAPAGLSTGEISYRPAPVDESPGRARLGVVVPKRLARRAVTRNLLRRAIREQAAGRRPPLPAGRWVVRLREGFDVRRYPSAASAALLADVRAELAGLLAGAG